MRRPRAILVALLSSQKTNVRSVPEDLDPLLRARIDKIAKARHFSKPGTHAEVLAVDESLKARRAAGLEVSDATIDSMVTYQEWLGPPYNSAKMCPNCSDILPGTTSIPGKR